MLAVLLLGLAMASEAQACSCAPISMREAFPDSDAAIIGRLVKVERAGGGFNLTYRVWHAYKGRHQIGRRVTVKSGNQPSACALPRRRHRSYGLFLYREHHHWASNLCSVVSPRKMRRAARRLGHGAGKIACATGT